MTKFFNDGQVTLYQGHVLDVLRELPSESVQCCVTSPPYWALRAYGTEPQVWGGDAGHEHVWQAYATPGRSGGTASAKVQIKGADNFQIVAPGVAADCPCGAWRGELGHEPTPQMFVAHLVEVFREVRRVLKSDGVCFVNLGDSYSGSHGNGYQQSIHTQNATTGQSGDFDLGRQIGRIDGLKPKDLVLIPERFALAMQDDGWYVRSRIAWCKRAPMPESVRDRPTNAWEHIWMLTKSARYYWDADAVREPSTDAMIRSAARGHTRGGRLNGRDASRNDLESLQKNTEITGTGRNLWSYWLLSPDPEPLAHFATFPREIPRRCIAAATSEKGECPQCGKSWVRVVERSGGTIGKGWHNHENDLGRGHRGGDNGHNVAADAYKTYKRESNGWAPQCACGLDPVPSTILDPFVGSGTTTMVARSMLRRSIGIDLNETYLRDIALRKNAQMALMAEPA